MKVLEAIIAVLVTLILVQIAWATFDMVLESRSVRAVVYKESQVFRLTNVFVHPDSTITGTDINGYSVNIPYP